MLKASKLYEILNYMRDFTIYLLYMIRHEIYISSKSVHFLITLS